MHITIVQHDGLVGVDGVFREVDLSTLDPAIRAIQFDTAKGTGHVEFDPDATIGVLARDAAAEEAAHEACNGDPALLAALQPIWMTVLVRRENEQLLDFTAYQKYVDAWTAKAPPPPPVPTLADVRAEATGTVDFKAEQVRLRYITAGSGQAGTYIEKAQQADSFKAAGYPASAVPPMVQAEADATGQTAQQACNTIIATRDQWLVKGAQIERERRRGKVNIDAAGDAAGVQAARDAAIAALDAL